MSRQAWALRRSTALLSRPLARPRFPRWPPATISMRFAHSPKPKLPNIPEHERPKLPKGVESLDESALTKPMDEAFFKSLGIRVPQSLEEFEQLEGPLTEEQINDPNATEISIYEQDHTSPTGERLIEHIRTPEDRRRHNELHKMMMRAESDPNYDDRELNRHLLDGLIKDPYFADLTDDLKDIKENWNLNKEQQESMLKDAEKSEEAWENEMTSTMQITMHEFLEEVMKDPMFEYAREELEAVQALWDLGDGSKYEEAMGKVMAKLSTDPNMEQKLAAWEAENGSIEELMKKEQEQETAMIEQPEDLTKLLRQMKDLMSAMGMGSPNSIEDGAQAADNALDRLEAQMEKILNEDPDNEDLDEEEITGRDMNFAELGKELYQLAKSSPEGGARNFDEDSEPIDPELEAKVDKIMKDPKLMEKLMYIQTVIKEEQEKANPMHLAPDPTKLEPSRITSIQKRMQVAKSDPEHRAAMEALRVQLARPFNVAPALRVFNEAIEYAYIGANDDIRRILWRAYAKARTLPTFLQSLSDDAWDIMYYSQAVTWTSNQNREDHLRLLLKDLRSVGKDGPPTHPDVVADMQR